MPSPGAPAPHRIRLSRKAGWRKPEGAVVVSRPTRWGNPFPKGSPHPSDPDHPLTRAESVALYREALLAGALRVDVDEVRRELAGRDLACWCPLEGPCHAEVLLAVANGTADDDADAVVAPGDPS